MDNKTMINQAVDKKSGTILDLSDRIFEYAEIGFREFKSSELFCEKLEGEGFEVTKGIAGMPTAFRAQYGTGKPVIGLMAEYDALPGLGQIGGCGVKTETKGNPGGHGCGHNLLGAGVFAAAVAIKEWLQENTDKGMVVVYGCPSEEKGNAKTIMARDGVFDELHVAFTWHPADRNFIISFSSLANISVYFDFKGVTSHAAAAPHMGRSALDAAELMSVGVNYLREHVIPEARIHYAYLDVGGTAPNVVQGSSRVHYFIRAPKTSQVLEIFDRVKDVAEGAALMTGTKGSYEIFSGVSDYMPNHVLSEVLYEAMVQMGAPEFDEEDIKIASAFYENHGPGSEDNCPLDRGIPPVNYNLPAMPGSTDVGDVSHVVPTAQLSYAAAALGTAMHTWQFTAQGNTSIAHKAVLAAGKAMALAAVRVMEDHELLELAENEWKKETGARYECPITKEVKPRLDD